MDYFEVITNASTGEQTIRPYTAAEIVAKLAGTPFVAAPAGLVLPQLQEVGYCALWAHDYLTGQGAWDSLTATALIARERSL
jgi:hypothetical protein